MHDLEKMVNIMETEYQLYNTLLDLSQKKTHAIANGKIKDLEKLVEAEEHLVLELSRVEDERERCVAELARQLGMDSKDVTISNLISHAEGELAERLSELQKKINKQISEQKRVNRLNEQLIKNNLEYINFSLGLLTGGGQPGVIYKKTGETDSKQQERNLIDKKA